MALARALAPEPQLLLLDEPFSNLDGELRRRLSHEVRDIHTARGTSAILVTHDQEEAFAVSDQVGVFNQGRLEQWDTPFNLYHEPASPFVASFVGQGYFIRGQLLSPDTVQTELGVIHGNRAYTMAPGSSVDVLLRPDDIVPDADSALQAQIVGKTFLGAATLYRLQLPTGSQLEAIFPSHADHQPGQQVGIRVAADHDNRTIGAGDVEIGRRRGAGAGQPGAAGHAARGRHRDRRGGRAADDGRELQVAGVGERDLAKDLRLRRTRGRRRMRRRGVHGKSSNSGADEGALHSNGAHKLVP